jgi:glucokinase
LGEAFLFWDGHRYHTIATEGGHTDFAPQDVVENDLLRFLIGRFGNHVSYERILSGPGLFNVYSFMIERLCGSLHPKVAQALAEGEDPSAIVSELGLSNADAIAKETLDLFCRIYGAEAGNMALKILAVGGVMIGGGIAPKILPVLKNGLFLQSFLRKGRFANFMKSLPLLLTTNPRVGIIGAAEYALEMASA